MKVTSFTGVTQIDNVKIFKPVSKIFIKTNYKGTTSGPIVRVDPLIRVRLVDGRSGRSDEVVPEMRLSILSELASKYEGFQRRADLNRSLQMGDYSHSGFDLCTVMLGAIVGLDSYSQCAAIDLSNDKYIDIDMRELDMDCTYEIWGFENHIISPNVRTYRKFFLSAGELEKTIHVEGNELLLFPMDKVKEIQFYAINGSSPVFRREEFILDEDGRNDLVSVALTNGNGVRIPIVPDSGGTALGVGWLPIEFGYSAWGVVDITPFNRFDFRRDDGIDAVTIVMIDTIPSVPTSVANV